LTASGVRVSSLRADQLTNPLGLDNPRPRLSWQLQATGRHVRQTAYQVLVASRPGLLAPSAADMWDSGPVASANSIGIGYAGVVPASRQRCWWTVRVWDHDAEPSEFAGPSWWEAGLTASDDWTAQWVTFEDEDQRADRAAGFVWIQDPLGRLDVSYEGTFTLASDADTGTILIPLGIQRVSLVVAIDGHVIPARVGEADFQVGEFDYGVPTGPLAAGPHQLRIDVAGQPTTHSAAASPVVAAFLRCAHRDGTTSRHGTGRDWSVSSAGQQAVAVAMSGKTGQPWPAAPARHARRAFHSESQPVRARLYVTALGVYEASLNGSRVGDHRLAPEISQYARRVYYQAYDVTGMVGAGENVLGLTVADGWYGYTSTDGRFSWAPPPLRALAQLELYAADGSRQVIGTDSRCRMHDSGLRRSEMKAGEIYDARLEPVGWDRPGFDDSAWTQAAIGSAPTAKLVAQVSPPVREIQVLPPRTISEVRHGVYQVDFGQNFAGACRLQVLGSGGTRIELRYAELLRPDGSIDPRSMGNPGLDGHDPEVFILRGAPEGEVFESRFTYRGFRYVQISGLPAAPSRDRVQGVVLHTDLRRTGWLRSSSRQIEELTEAIRWTFKSNYVCVPTDCPSREQHGWLGDASYAWDAGSFLMDTAAFTSRYLEAVRDDQFPDGCYPMVAPYPLPSRARHGEQGTSPSWATAGVLLPWSSWQRYGDPAVIERNWEAMSRFAEYIELHNPDYIWRNRRGFDWGDWLAPDDPNVYFEPDARPRTPGIAIACAYWAFIAALMADMAEATQRADQAKRYRDVFERVRSAFAAEFVATDGTVATGSQTCFVLALRFGLVPDDLRAAAADLLARDVRDHGPALTVGIVGTQFMLDVLADEGYPDLAYDLLLSEKYPSWGHMLRNGATTIWEYWSGDMDYDGAPIPMSQNHPALGSVAGFLFRRVAGISAAAPGFERITIHPLVDPRVPRNGADYDTVRGRISVDWERLPDGSFRLDATLPPGTTSTIHLPTGPEALLMEGGRAVRDRDPDIEIVSRDADSTIVRVGSGSYRFATA
jgi:alpha-L-rhamnosidase